MEEKDYEQEFADLMAAKEAGRANGDGPADVAPVVEVGDHE